MKKIGRFFLWWGLLSKRLLRRPAYLAVLLLVPLFALALSLFTGQESGVLQIALAAEDPADPAAAAVIARLTEGRSVLLCRDCGSEEAACEAVEQGRADAAWIFSAGLEQKLERFAQRGRASAVRVVEREDNVLLMLSREKLFAALYPEASFAIFSDYLASELGAEELEPSLLRSYYERLTFTDELVRFETLEGETVEEEGSYLTAPLRGIMALLLVLCGMASGLYAYREEREGSFVWLPARTRRWLPVLGHLTAILPPTLAAMAALALAGLTVDPGRELLILLLYLPATALFCELLRCLCPREEHYGALIPVLTAAMLVLCPVFLDLNLLRPLCLLLPPWWALRAVWNGAALLGLLLYTLALALLTGLLSLLRQKRRAY